MLYRYKNCILANLVFLFGAAVLFCSCSDNGKGSALTAFDDTLRLQYARLLQISYGDDACLVKVASPWDGDKPLAMYMLGQDSARRDHETTDGLYLKTPLRRAVVFSGVHAALLRRLGALNCMAGVCDANFILDKEIAAAVADGRISDCGNSQNPDIERIIALKPDAILISPYQDGSQFQRLSKLGIPVIQCADYLEDTPLGRAEWVHFFGLLTGKTAMADSIWQETSTQYLNMRHMAQNTPGRPVVLCDGIYGGIWYQPTAKSTMGVMIEDAGGTNPFADAQPTGTAALAPEQVLATAQNADVWLLRYRDNDKLTTKQWGEQNHVYRRFKAFGQGNIYGCNTQTTDFFESTPFSPHLFLAELINILHPELSDSMPASEYFFKLLP